MYCLIANYLELFQILMLLIFNLVTEVFQTWHEQEPRHHCWLSGEEGATWQGRGAASISWGQPSTASQSGTGVAVLKGQETEFCQQPEWAWNQSLPSSLQKGTHLPRHWFFCPGRPVSDFWPTEMWDHKQAVLGATKFVVYLVIAAARNRCSGVKGACVPGAEFR